MAENFDIPGLEFEIKGKSDDAAQGIQRLQSALKKLKTAASGGATGLDKAARQIRSLRNALSEIDSRSISNVSRLATALSDLRNAGSIRPSAIKRISELSDVISKVRWTDGDKLESLTTGLKAVSSVGKAHLTTFLNQLGKLPEIIDSLDRADIDKFSDQMVRLSEAMRPFAMEMWRVAQGFAAFPSRIQRLIQSTKKYNAVVGKAADKTDRWGGAFRMLRFGSIFYMMTRISHVIASLIDKSADYTENLNLFKVAMGEYGEEAFEFAEKASKIMGIDVSDWTRNQAVFQTLLTGFGQAGDRAALMSKNLTQLGYDLSSFFNITVEDAMQKLQSGISGELEPLNLAA